MFARSTIASAVLATLTLGCTSGGSSDGREATAPPVVTLTATDYAFEAPDTLPAGWTTFRLVNHGATLHTAQLVRLEEGRTLAEFRQAYEHAWRTVGPRPVWGKRVGGPGGAEPGATSNATMYLEPGSYGWYCPMDIEDGVPHVFGKGMARSLTVVPREDGGGENSKHSGQNCSLSPQNGARLQHPSRMASQRPRRVHSPV